ncbi:hypothetical protein DFH29DRAFT_1009459 [Suillus ampliporus]|nr:hypothetical protein DFH29DRAFT_1009459 [Suillus ampliporus]
MSCSPKVLAVRAYLDRVDNNDVDGAPPPLGVLGESYGDGAGVNQVGFKAYREKIARHLTYKTIIENIIENQAGKVIVRGTARASSSTPPYIGENPSTAEYEFVGDKISKVMVMGNHSLPFPM